MVMGFEKSTPRPFINLTVLIIEPVDNMRVTIASMLIKLSFKEVIQARNGAEAVILMEKENIDVILSDYHLPKVDGIELLARIRENSETARTPFIMLSSTIEHDEVLLAIQNGVSEYIVKPFSIKLLHQRILDSIETPIKSTASLLNKSKSISGTKVKISEEKPTILIVDDISDNIHLIAEILREDYKVKGVLSGKKAIKICQSRAQPDLVLLDIMMPEMDGLEVCKILKSDPLTQHIAIIFLTAVEHPLKIVEGLELGAIDYITKPITPSITKARVNTHINTIKNNKLLKSQLDTMVENISLRDEFDRIMQNDLKTPIKQMFIAIDDISKSAKNPTVVANIAKNLKQSCLSLSLQVNNMAVLYKLEDGSYKIVPITLNFSTIVMNAIDSLKLLIERKKLEIDIDFNETCFIKGEELLTSSIVASILQNAIEAAPIGSVLHVNIKSKNKYQQLKVTNCSNIPAEIQNTFFDKYSTFGKKGASGIGTYSAKLMTNIQQGTITFDSSISNETTLTVLLPANT